MARFVYGATTWIGLLLLLGAIGVSAHLLQLPSSITPRLSCSPELMDLAPKVRQSLGNHLVLPSRRSEGTKDALAKA